MAYIDKDLLLQDIEESVVFSVREGKPSLEIRGARKIVDRIENAPTVDAVEVVRCKDCVCYEQGIVDWCNHWLTGTNGECFCSYGERKET